MRRHLFALAGLSAFAVQLGCAQPEAPARPSWDEDVYPILKGHCLHCHGETGLTTGGGFRFDVCSLDQLKDVSSAAPSMSAAAFIPIMLNSVKVTKKMPPAPADPLSDYEITVLENWQKLVDPMNTIAACPKRGSNAKPTAKLIGNTRKDGNKLIATVEISDADGDQVFSIFRSGNTSLSVPSAGRREISIDNAGDNLTAKLSDGYATVDLTLK